jgi:hypothetical protein
MAEAAVARFAVHCSCDSFGMRLRCFSTRHCETHTGTPRARKEAVGFSEGV